MYIEDNAFKSKHEMTVKKDGFTITKCCYEVENGFVVYIRKSKDYEEGSTVKPSDGYYEPEVTCFISKTNPFEVAKKKQDDIKDLDDMLENY